MRIEPADATTGSTQFTNAALETYIPVFVAGPSNGWIITAF